MTNSQFELRALLPWYVNGTLDASTRQDMELELQQSPALRSELVWLTMLRSQVRDLTQAECSPRSDDAGLDSLMALIHGEQSGKVTPLRKNTWAWVAAARKMPLSMGIAAAIVLSQAVIIGALLDKSSGDLKPMSGGTAVVGGQMLQLTFKPQATEGEIRALLAAVQGEIVAGPGALGVYVVRVPDNQGQHALLSLRNGTTVVDSVVLLPSR